jgi:hypothetical protein
METTTYRPSRASTAFDADEVTPHSYSAPYIRERAERADLSPHDPVPLFLSDPEGEPDPQEFAPFAARRRVGLATQIVAGVLAASAIAVLVTLFQSDISRLFVLVVNAKEPAVATSETAAPPVRLVQLKDPARVSNPMPPGSNPIPPSSAPMLASADAKTVAAPATPSREAIATAYQAALQTQAPPPVMPVQAPSTPSPASAPPAKTLDADTLAGLMTRAKSLMAVGDITAARLLLERAANAQDASAAFLLAQTYDPAVLGTNDIRSITTDAKAARDWYQKAAQLGSAEARQRLTQFQN